MPVQHAEEGGRPGFRWGGGSFFPYDPASTASVQRAHRMSTREGVATLIAVGHRFDAAPKVLLPSRIESAYTRQLVARARAANELLLERLVPVMDRTGIDERARADSATDDLAKLLRVVESARAAFGKAYAPDMGALGSVAASVGTFATAQQKRQGLIAITVGNGADGKLLTAWTRENVSLIKSIDARYFDDVRDTVIEAVRKGRPTNEIVSLLRDRYAVSKSRAELIASDQVAKLNGAITMKRQTDLGVMQYRWSTSLDARVRPEHRAREGRIFSWSDAPADGHPGQPIRCRCVAIPILPGDDTKDLPRGATAYRGAFAR